jgi:hypothetical protein
MHIWVRDSVGTSHMIRELNILGINLVVNIRARRRQTTEILGEDFDTIHFYY